MLAIKGFIKKFAPLSLQMTYKKIKILFCSAFEYIFSEPKNFKYDLAIVAIIKNEGRYIDEWIKYHLLVGVQHFYLYNNESEDNIQEILKDYIKRGIVDLIYFPGKAQQIPAYQNALKKYRNECKYMAVVDADEFIRPIDHNKNILDVIEEIFKLAKNNKRVAGVYIAWKMFGSSGHVKMPEGGGVLNNFLHCEETGSNPHRMGKVIINPRKTFYFLNPHFQILGWGNIFYMLNENGEKILSCDVKLTLKKICIHHYFTKSKTEFLIKRNRGRADLLKSRPLKDFDIFNFNDVYDDSMLYYADKLENIKTYGK